MYREFIIINGIILFYIIQRVSEMTISQTNEKWLKLHNEAVEVDSKESLLMKVFHTTWFMALILESNLKHNLQEPKVSILIWSLLILCLIVRFHTMRVLKQFWTIKIFSMKNQIVSTSGLFNYIRHPNYLIVIFEFILIPLLFKAYLTMILFSLMNLYVLSRRIKLEEDTIMSNTNYEKLFLAKKRLIPFLFLIIFSFTAYAAETNYHFADYNEAKKADAFIKFESTSTKFGLLTTSFNGYAKDIQINYLTNKSVDQLTHLETIIPVKGLDTDINSRNEKMIHEIFDAAKYPNIIINLPHPITLVAGEYTAEMIFTIKDKKIAKAVKYKITKNNDKYFISGSTTLSLKETGLPDPSIRIAKVRDTFDLNFAIAL